MATLTRAAISAALSLIMSDRATDQFRRDVVLLNLLSVEPGRNDTCTNRIKIDGRTAGGAYAEGADMDDSDYDSHTRLRASLNWAEYRKGAKVSGLAMAVSSASGGTGMEMDLFDEEVVDAIDELAIEVGADLYAGNPAASPVELAGAAIAIDSNTGVSFAGIDPATYADWVGNEDTLATADLSISNLRAKIHRPIKDATGQDPDFVTCPGDIFDQIKDLLGDKAQTIQQVRTANGMVDILAAAGARAISVDGVPYIEDRHYTASTLYGWSARHVKIKQVPAKTPTPETVRQAIKALTGVDVPLDEVEEKLRAMKSGGAVRPTVEILAQTGDAYKAMIKVYIQLAWSRRNAFAKLTLT